MGKATIDHYDSYSVGKRIFDACNAIKESICQDRCPSAVLIDICIGNYYKLKQEMSWADLEAIEQAFTNNITQRSEHVRNIFLICDGEYIVFADGFENSEKACRFAECDFLNEMTTDYQSGDLVVGLKIFAGYTLFDDSADAYELVDHARFAMRMALQSKSEVMGRFEWDPYLKSIQLVEKRAFLKEVHVENQLYSVFQPIIDVKLGTIFGYEALSRTTNTVFGSIWELIECAKNTKYLKAINELMATNHLWTFAQLKSESKKLFINMDAKTSEELKDQNCNLINLIYDLGFQPGDVVLEFTERDDIDSEAFCEHIRALRNEGVLLAVDNYGTGGCSGLELIKLRPDIVKLDKKLIEGIDTNSYKKAFVNSILKFCEAADMMLIAEGVETLEEAKTLLKIGVEKMQGFYFAKPQPTPIKDIHIEL
jgi:EAL domain-containing protein (putative c-di-GMP-specific phosphodiesterase class I)